MDGFLIKKIAGIVEKRKRVKQRKIGGTSVRLSLIATKFPPQMAMIAMREKKCKKFTVALVLRLLL